MWKIKQFSGGVHRYPGPRGFSWFFSTWESCERATILRERKTSGHFGLECVWIPENIHTSPTEGIFSRPSTPLEIPIKLHTFLWIFWPYRTSHPPGKSSAFCGGGGEYGYFLELHNLTFMQTPAVKCVNLIIQRGTNGSLAITCLSGTNVSTRVVKRSIFWPTWPWSTCMFARMFSSATIAKFCLLPRDFWIERHNLLWADDARWCLCWNATVLHIREYESPPETSEHTTKIMTQWGYE